MTKRQKKRRAELLKCAALGAALLNEKCPRRFSDPEGKHQVPYGTPEYETAPFEERIAVEAT